MNTIKLFRIPVLVALAAALILAPQASAALPPGNSGVDQYTEGVPGAGGNKSSDGGGSGASGGSSLPPAVIQQLSQSGTIGQALARVAVITTPQSKKLRRAARKAAAAGAGAGAGKTANSAPANRDLKPAALLNSVDDGSGPLLPILLGALGLLGVAALAVRNMNSGGADPA